MKNNWQEVKLGYCLDKMVGGGTPSKENFDYWNGSIPWASVKDVVTHNPNDTLDHVSELGIENSSTRIIKNGTLIVPTRMALGHAVFFNVDVAINQDLKALYPKDFLGKKYLYYWFVFKKKDIEKLGSGSTVSGISQDTLKAQKFLLPPIEEQGRIVRVLECWDGYLEKLGRKIEVKKNIKKALMQKLLTGEKRLAGFSDKWQAVKLGDVSKMRSGGTPKSSVPEFYDGVIPWVSISDMTKCGKFLFSTERTLSKKGMENSAAFLYPKGTILYAMYASIGECVIAGIETTSSQAILGIQPKIEKLDSIFLYFYLVMLKEKIKLQGQQGTQSNLNAGIVRNFILHLPKLEEQKAIAEILTKADDEIMALEKKKEIVEAQKKFLLNNLVTGKILTPNNI